MKYKISDLAKLMNVSTNTIRRYEKMGYFNSDRNSTNSYRMYDEESVFQAINARLLRKYGFSHEELAKMKTFSMDENIRAYEDKMKEIEETIANLSNIHHRLKDDLILMHKSIDKLGVPYLKTCVDMYYSIYQEGHNLINDPEHQKVINTFIYDYPEVQRIYLMKKEDIDSKKYKLYSAWSIKGYLAKRINLHEDKYINYYPSTNSIMCMEKISSLELNEASGEVIFNQLSKNIGKIMQESGLVLNGDVIAVTVSKCFEDNKEMIYVLISAPVKSIL